MKVRQILQRIQSKKPLENFRKEGSIYTADSVSINSKDDLRLQVRDKLEPIFDKHNTFYGPHPQAEELNSKHSRHLAVTRQIMTIIRKIRPQGEQEVQKAGNSSTTT